MSNDELSAFLIHHSLFLVQYSSGLFNIEQGTRNGEVSSFVEYRKRNMEC
jgi:hypothetical protein